MNRLSCLLLGLALVAGCSSDSGGGSNAIPTAPSAGVPFTTIDLRVGTGAEAVNGRRVTLNYTGWVWSSSGTDNKGAQFDSSLSPGRTPFAFNLGNDNVIQGWHRGIVGMRVGGQRRLIIPPELAYGNTPPSSAIRANETLIFDVELLSVNN